MNGYDLRVVKLECLKIKHHTNHSALRAKLYLNSIRHAYEQLTAMAAV